MPDRPPLRIDRALVREPSAHAACALRSKAALPPRVLRHRRAQIIPPELGPHLAHEDHLGVGDLPEQKVAQAVLPRCPDQEVHVRAPSAVPCGEKLGSEGRLVD